MASMDEIIQKLHVDNDVCTRLVEEIMPEQFEVIGEGKSVKLSRVCLSHFEVI